MSPLEEKVTALLAELADARPVALRTPPERAATEAGSARRPDYVATEAPATRRRRRPLLVAAAVLVVLAVVGGALVLGRSHRSPVVASLSDLPVDTSLLGDGRMAVVVENQLYVADGPTGQVWQLTDTGKGEEVSNVSFSHDGEWVAFTIHDESGLWVSRWDGSERHRIGRAPSTYTWSPTDDQLAYATQDEVRIARTDGSSRALEGGPGPTPYTRVVWSPDGQSLAFAQQAFPGAEGQLIVVTPQGADDPGWGKPSQYTTSAAAVYAWPLDGVVVSAVGTGGGQLQADLLLSVRSQALTDVTTNTVPDPVDVVGPTVAVVSPNAQQVSTCDLADLTCRDLFLPSGPSYVDPVLSATGGRLAVVGGVVGSNLFVVDLADDSVRDFGRVSPGPWGTYGGDIGYGVGTEPPVWIDEGSLLVRVDSSSVVRIDATTGERSTVVTGDRFLPPADDYPGGTGLAYWSPR